MEISVIGGGYMGLVTAACLAELGNVVTVVDIDPYKVTSINAGKPGIVENGLEELLSKNVGIRLFASDGYECVASSDISFICVDTPMGMEGRPVLKNIESASLAIGEALRECPHSHVVVIKSTVPPGTTEAIIRPKILSSSGRDEKNTDFIVNPEFLREGHAVSDFLHPDRIILGCNGGFGRDLLRQLYHKIKAPVVIIDIKTAEMSKYAANAFLATKISFANEIGNVCKCLGINVYEVMTCVGMDHRISPNYLDAGVGFGGSCLPKDVNGLIDLARRYGEKPALLESVMEVNAEQPKKLVTLLEKRIGNLSGKRIAILGLAFKENTDDIRESRAIPVIETLLSKGACVAGYDPLGVENMKQRFPSLDFEKNAVDALRGSDACLILTACGDFSNFDSEFSAMKERVIIEGRMVLSCRDKEGICW